MQDLAEKRAIVTGGGSGIGFGIARRLLEAGAIVTIAGRTLEKLESAKAKLEAMVTGGEVRIARCDVTRPNELEPALDIAEAGGRIDIAVANAGGMGSMAGPFLFLDDKAWRELCEINIIGSANTIRQAALRMRAGGGSIIAVSTAVSRAPQTGNAHYTVTKAALNQMVISAASELGRFGIRVNALLPGLTPTELAGVETPGGLFEDHIARTALGRVSNPLEQGDLVAFLASERAGFITGQLIAVDGGLSIQPQSDITALTRAMFGDTIHDQAGF